ncbi:cysteine--tRNA ligase [Thalassovita sp.]|uniref:cysteine--tRNA ligase n=1 Tax=Thalassovita sp. TaxID=1979401 RepID=UPI0029DE568C|nr:cysteine--tRNA ligase [Thalassovita sp.]
MTTIKLHNSKTRKKEVFQPIDPKNVRMYVCGPTVYDRAHIGNARPVIVFDTLFRLLRHVYGADHVTYVRNFTDVDDKINAKAAETGRPIGDITAETTQWYLDDMRAVGALDPTEMPRATAYIGAMITMIEDLIAKGHAYVADGHVLFSVSSYKDYGALSGRSLDDMIAGARVEVAPYKRDPMDFVLWKPSSDDLPGWDSPWGRGRPGWHIECSAMSYELLGESFDIHGGGNDLMFPHHENEIAQSCCAHPEGGFAKVWMHNEMLQVEGKKMSKSLGNFFTVRDLLDGHDGEKGVPGEVIRFVFLSTHYGKPMDWTAKKANDAEKTISFWASEIGPARWIVDEYRADAEGFAKAYAQQELVDALADNLNTSLAISMLFKLEKKLRGLSRAELTNDELDATLRKLLAGCYLLGIDVLNYYGTRESGVEDLSSFAAKFAKIRAIAMQTKDFSEVDRVKAILLDAGIEVRMSKDGVELIAGPDFDPSKLEGL